MPDGNPAVTPWSDLLARARGSGGTWTLEVTQDWMQGRTVFGGLQAAFALRAMRALVPDVPLRTLQGTFLAPPSAGTLTVRAAVLRQGKSATHVEARLVDGDATLAILVGVFGLARESAVKVLPQMPPPPANAKPIDFPFVPGLTPNFTQHFKVRWLRGTPPYMGDHSLENVIEVSMRDRGPATEGHVLGIADFLPPVALSHLKKPAPGSTLTWMVEMLADRVDTLSLQGWRIDVALAAARDGYTSQQVMLWGPGGVPVAMSRQSMVVFG